MIEIYLLMSTIYSRPYGKPDIPRTIVHEIKHEFLFCDVEGYSHIYYYLILRIRVCGFILVSQMSTM